MTLNYAVGFAVWIVIFAGVLVATVPHPPVPALIAMSVVVLVGVPVWFYPRSKATWASVEWLANRTDPDYRPWVPRGEQAQRLE